jgi:hypothetical protein
MGASGAETMKRSRRNHTAAFKAKAALAAIKGDGMDTSLPTGGGADGK